MAVRKSSWLSLYAVIALLFAVFVAPAVDAAACASEGPIAAAHMVTDQVEVDNASSGDSEERGGNHGVCSHGHCHHGSVGRISSGTDTFSITLSEDRTPFVDDALPSYASEGLKRPPKA